MQGLKAKYENEYGYVPETYELYDLYTQGELYLSDAEENALLEAVEAEY